MRAKQQNLGRKFGTGKIYLSPHHMVTFEAEVLWLLICCLVCFPLVVGILCMSLFCCTFFFTVLSSFGIISKRKRKMGALL